MNKGKEGIPSRDAARSKVPTKKPTTRKTRRSVRSVLRKSFPHAPGDLLEMIENWMSVKTLKEFEDLSASDGEAAIRSALNRYSNRVIGNPGMLPKGFAEKLEEYAEKENLDYGSLFSRRAHQVLIDAIVSISEYNGYDSIKKQLD